MWGKEESQREEGRTRLGNYRAGELSRLTTMPRPQYPIVTADRSVAIDTVAQYDELSFLKRPRSREKRGSNIPYATLAH